VEAAEHVNNRYFDKFVKMDRMKTAEMKQKLHHFIETVEEKRMKAMYALFEKEIAEEEWEYTDEFKAELDRRNEAYLNWGDTISSEDADKQTKVLLMSLSFASQRLASTGT
jgi:hypothetical protein